MNLALFRAYMGEIRVMVLVWLLKLLFSDWFGSDTCTGFISESAKMVDESPRLEWFVIRLCTEWNTALVISTSFSRLGNWQRHHAGEGGATSVTGGGGAGDLPRMSSDVGASRIWNRFKGLTRAISDHIAFIGIFLFPSPDYWTRPSTILTGASTGWASLGGPSTGVPGATAERYRIVGVNSVETLSITDPTLLTGSPQSRCSCSSPPCSPTALDPSGWTSIRRLLWWVTATSGWTWCVRMTPH